MDVKCSKVFGSRFWLQVMVIYSGKSWNLFLEEALNLRSAARL